MIHSALFLSNHIYYIEFSQVLTDTNILVGVSVVGAARRAGLPFQEAIEWLPRSSVDVEVL